MDSTGLVNFPTLLHLPIGSPHKGGAHVNAEGPRSRRHVLSTQREASSQQRTSCIASSRRVRCNEDRSGEDTRDSDGCTQQKPIQRLVSRPLTPGGQMRAASHHRWLAARVGEPLSRNEGSEPCSGTQARITGPAGRNLYAVGRPVKASLQIQGTIRPLRPDWRPLCARPWHRIPHCPSPADALLAHGHSYFASEVCDRREPRSPPRALV